jgi:predicted nucleic acid-binding protein
LDISILLAWLLAQHEKNAAVLAWETGKEVAICPLTELGFLRIACHTYGVVMADARKALADWKQKRRPRFIPCDISALEGRAASSHKETTDYYFGNLAEKHGLKWATLDAQSRHPAACLL